MVNFKKRTFSLVLAIALTVIVVCATENNIEISEGSNVQNLTHTINDITSQSIYNEDLSTTITPVEDEFATLHENKNVVIVEEENNENSILETQESNNTVEDVQNNIQETNTIYSTQNLPENSQNNTHEILMLTLSVLLIIVCSVFFFLKAKNRLTEIAGENFEIETETLKEKEKTKEEKKKLKKIKETVNTLDKIYSKTAVRNSYAPKSQHIETKEKINNIKEVPKDKIVNLDEILGKKSQITDEKTEIENQALEDFLNGFSYYEEEDFTKSEVIFDENYLEKVMCNNNISFKKQDLECINKLLRLEINDEVLNNPQKFLVSNPIVINRKVQIIDQLISDYAINKNITFTEEDFVAIEKIMNVELDNDFITDLRINPKPTKQMQKELKDFDNESKKPTKIQTLKVKDLLPDLSEALIKQGGRRIESNYRPEAVYYQKGYDVKVMSVSDYLPNLSKEINVDQANEKSLKKEKNLLEYNLLDENYEVATLHISNTLPDLSKEINMPQTSNSAPVENINLEQASENLLKNLNNVKFKDFVENKELEIKNDDIQSIGTNKIADDINRKLVEKKVEKNIIEDKKLACKLKNLDNTDLAKNITENSKCIVGNEAFLIKQTVILKENIGCYLAKNDSGYHLLSYVGDKVALIKNFKELKSEKLQARLIEKIQENKFRFIIRVGFNNKLLVEVENNEINYLMDL